MKKIYSSIFVALAMITVGQAQTVVTFEAESYHTAPVIENIGNHADWNSSGPAWHTDNDLAQIVNLKSNWARCVYSVPFKAEGTKNTVTARVTTKLGGDDSPFQDAEGFLLVAFQDTDAATGASNNTNRDGVIIKSTAVAGDKVFLGVQGSSAFETNPSISQADKSTYEIILEIEVGDSPENSNLRTRLSNLESGETSEVAEAKGINQATFDAINGDGAYLLLYTFNPFQGEDGTDYQITSLYVNEIVLDVIESSTLSVKNEKIADFKLYPNPVNNELRINSISQIQNVEIFDLLGKSVLSLNNVQDKVNVSSLKSALYIVRITTQNGVSTKKFIKN
ncbi:T9SS type A sorting domain-containing protein [Formosa sp. PL04]|uniref:T9SS type A sorting domain-containing protein n=1 Tax=Formosa sp. PL04 TaxID=3081755 RepID=UPI002982AF36|nr:T9SS type A sorting domain-containing protein [Formosa sp. PL04]MDW5288069.1 T9SS type A sorting domain-containing protein [Formosa sp. PL04]